MLLLVTLTSATHSTPAHLEAAHPGAVGPAAPPDLPAGFFVENAASGALFDLPTAIAFAPDGRIFVAEKRGRVYVITKEGTKVATPFINLEAEVLNHHDRGLLGLALDPNFSSNSYVYLLYTVDRDGAGDYNRRDVFGRLVRYTASSSNANVADLSTRKVLIGATFSEGIPACAVTHAPGSIRFGTDGTMLISTGDGAFALGEADAGGLHPECFGPDRIDPMEDVGAFRSQYLKSLAGKILRIDPETGLGLPSNPFYTGNASDNQSRVWAYGLRNPFRFNVRQNGSTNPADGRPGSLYIGDVGWATWEDLNVAASSGLNFGWPCYEGPQQQSKYQNATPAHSGCSTIGAVTAPLLYWHFGDATRSRPSGLVGESIIGGAFYTGTKYPAEYQGRFFYADYVHGWMASAKFDASNRFVEQQVFSTSTGAVVGIEYDPVSQLLYYVHIGTGEVLRLRYGSGSQNEPPVALASASPTKGSVPLAVQFTGSTSYDPEGGALTYRWNFGDGGSSTLADPLYTYNTAGTFEAALTVTDASGASASYFLDITAGNSPPDGTILSPADGAVVSAGDVVQLNATATDPDEPASNLQYQWKVTLIHGTHEHPDFFTSTQKTTSFTVTAHGSDGDTYGFKIQLLVTDSGGLTDVSTHTISVRSGSSGTQLTNGLYGQYFDNADFTGATYTRIDPKIQFNWGTGAPYPGIGANQFSIRWTGWVKPLYSQTYTFYTESDDGARLWVNGKLLVDKWVAATDKKLVRGKGNITLQAGQLYEIKLEYFDATGRALVRLLWSSPSQSKVIVPNTQLFTSGSAGTLASMEPESLLEAAEAELSEASAALPETYLLDQNHPNPFNPETTIRFALPEAAPVTLVVYDMLGRRVAELKREEALEAGWHSVAFDARSLPSGTYVYRLTAGSYTATKLMVLVK